jgi:hypothetical protein
MVLIQHHHHKHIHRILHHMHHVHHTLHHIGELLFMGAIGCGSLLFASYNTSYEHLHRDTQQEINTTLAQAIVAQIPDPTKSKVISVWEMDGLVDNTFVPGYCTY